MNSGLLVYLQDYARLLLAHFHGQIKFFMSVLFDNVALRYVHRGGCPSLEKASWDSLLEETMEKM